MGRNKRASAVSGIVFGGCLIVIVSVLMLIFSDESVGVCVLGILAGLCWMFLMPYSVR